MRVLIASCWRPFSDDRAPALTSALVAAFRRSGHEVDASLLPFSDDDPAKTQLMGLRLIDASTVGSQTIDLFVAIDAASALLRHPNKVIWLLHQFRQVYDFWGTPYQETPSSATSLALRDIVRTSDGQFLREARHIFTNSKTVADRLKRFSNMDGEVLFPPLMDAELFHPGDSGPYIFYPSRINSTKRQILAVQAMRYVRSGVTLVLAGKADDAEQQRQLERTIEQEGVQDRVQVLGWVSQEQKADLCSKCLACLYLPYDEDSYGYVTLEGFQSHKPVITCTDSGGTLELIEDGVNGRVVPPDAHELAAAIDDLAVHPMQTRTMGEHAYATLARLDISWDHVIRSLTS